MNDILHIYTRVSSAIQQEEGTSLEAQKQIGIRRAEELGFDHRLWNEGGQSSFHDDLHNRPVLVSLLTLIETGTVKHLFVYNTDRLSRNQQTWAVIRYKLLAHGVTLFTASGQMKLKNPVDDLMLGILSEISQYDNRIRAERSRLGRFHKVQQGNWKGGPPPFGYRLADRRLEVDPFESEWVRKMYEWYCHGVAVKEIQSRLGRQGVLTRRGNEQWSLGSIQLILRNPVYAGYFDYTDKMVGETVRIQTPTIIDPPLFEVAMKRRRATQLHRNQINRTKHFYLLRGVLVCGHCGTPMGGRTRSADHQHLYYCVRKERAWKNRDDTHPKWTRGTGCSMVRSLNIQKTDQLVWTIVKSVLQQIWDRYPASSDLESSESPHHSKRDRILSDQFPWMSPDQIDLLSDEEKKQVIGKVVTSVRAYLDVRSGKHRVDVEFSAEVTRLSGDRSDATGSDNPHRNPSETLSEAFCDVVSDQMGTSEAEKSNDSNQTEPAEINYSVTVE